MTWIKITPETLPPINEDVLGVKFNLLGHFFQMMVIKKVSLYGDKLYFWTNDGTYLLTDFSHWQPLPPPPEVDQ